MSAENDAKLAKALQRAGWIEPQAAPASPWAGLPAMNAGFAAGRQIFDPRGFKGAFERFGAGVADELPDRAVPSFMKPAQEATAAPRGSWREGLADSLMDPMPNPADGMMPGGAMTRQTIGGFLKDPVRQGMEFTGYPGARRAIDAGSEALQETDPVTGAGRLARSLGEGWMATATISGNAIGLGKLGAKIYRAGTPIASMPDIASMPQLKARVNGFGDPEVLAAKAGERAAEAESRIRPVDWAKVDREARPKRAPAPQQRPERDAYTPYEFSPEDEALLKQSWEAKGSPGIFDSETLAPQSARASGAQPGSDWTMNLQSRTGGSAFKTKAEINAEIERLALQAEDAGQAGDSAGVAKAHEDIASIMARTGRPLETSPRLSEIQNRIDAIDKELRTADGAWREEELLAEADALMNERRSLRGKAPRSTGEVSRPPIAGANGGGMFDFEGNLIDDVRNWARSLGKKDAASNDQSAGFRLGQKSEPWETPPHWYRSWGAEDVPPANDPRFVPGPDAQKYQGALLEQKAAQPAAPKLDVIEGGAPRGPTILGANGGNLWADDVAPRAKGGPGNKAFDDRDVLLGVADKDRDIDMAGDFNVSTPAVFKRRKQIAESIAAKIQQGTATKEFIAGELGVTPDVVDEFLARNGIAPGEFVSARDQAIQKFIAGELPALEAARLAGLPSKRALYEAARRMRSAPTAGQIAGALGTGAGIAKLQYDATQHNLDAAEEQGLPAWMVGLPGSRQVQPGM